MPDLYKGKLGVDAEEASHSSPQPWCLQQSLMLSPDFSRGHGCRPDLLAELALLATNTLLSENECVPAVMDHLDFGQAAEELTQAAEYLRKEGATKVGHTLRGLSTDALQP